MSAGGGYHGHNQQPSARNYAKLAHRSSGKLVSGSANCKSYKSSLHAPIAFIRISSKNLAPRTPRTPRFFEGVSRSIPIPWRPSRTLRELPSCIHAKVAKVLFDVARFALSLCGKVIRSPYTYPPTSEKTVKRAWSLFRPFRLNLSCNEVNGQIATNMTLAVLTSGRCAGPYPQV